MSKTLFYRLFGLGKIPKKALATIEQEGVVLKEEGIGLTVTFRKFRAPGKRYGYRSNWSSGSLVITEQRLWGLGTFTPVVSVPFNHERFSKLNCSTESDNILCISFEAADFIEQASGEVTCRFKTPLARTFLDHIRSRSSAN